MAQEHIDLLRSPLIEGIKAQPVRVFTKDFKSLRVDQRRDADLLDFVFFIYNIHKFGGKDISINKNDDIDIVFEDAPDERKRFHVALWHNTIKKIYKNHKYHILKVRRHWNDTAKFPKHFGIGSLLTDTRPHNSIEMFRQAHEYYVYNVKNIDQPLEKWIVQAVRCPLRHHITTYPAVIVNDSTKPRKFEHVPGPDYPDYRDIIEHEQGDGGDNSGEQGGGGDNSGEQGGGGGNGGDTSFNWGSLPGVSTVSGAIGGMLPAFLGGSPDNIDNFTFKQYNKNTDPPAAELTRIKNTSDVPNDEEIDVIITPKQKKASDGHLRARATMQKNGGDIIFRQNKKTVTVNLNWLRNNGRYNVYKI